MRESINYVSVKDVLDYWVKGYNIENETIAEYDYFYDPTKGVFVLKFALEEKSNVGDGDIE